MEKKQAPLSISLEKNYDSEFCGSIPLHLVNMIQPHGVLLVLHRQDLRLVQVSENFLEILDKPLEELIEQPISEYISENQIKELQQRVQNQSHQDKIPFTLTLKTADQEILYTALVHLKPEYLIIELEESPLQADATSFIKLYQDLKHITSELKLAQTKEAISQTTAAEIKKLSGFDSVLVYQFDPQWNGIVLGQAREEDMNDYMGLRFPASDVPRQTRDLYFKNPYRLIPTRQYTPVRLLPIINPLTQQFTDLSECNLRSVVAVHLEYLANMKVMASMSFPIIIDNRLWGLISCHHKTSKNPSYELRAALDLLTGIVSTHFLAQEKEESIEYRSELRGIHATLLEKLYNTATFTEGLLQADTSIKNLLNLSGVAVLFEGEILTSGQVPTHQELKELVYWLTRNNTEKVFATDSLPKHYVRAKDYKDVGSGLIALSINSDQREYVLGFRPEVLQTVDWGGDPDQAIQMEADGKAYHPRNSFATYQQTVRHTSLPWQPEEIEAAEVLRSAVLEKIIKERR